MSDDFDIIIIGAGIAGTACALRCVPAMWYWRKGQQPAGRALWIPASSLDNRNGIKETLALDKGIFRDLTQHTDVILKKSYEVLHGGLDNVNSIQSWSNA